MELAVEDAEEEQRHPGGGEEFGVGSALVNDEEEVRVGDVEAGTGGGELRVERSGGGALAS